MRWTKISRNPSFYVFFDPKVLHELGKRQVPVWLNTGQKSHGRLTAGQFSQRAQETACLVPQHSGLLQNLIVIDQVTLSLPQNIRVKISPSKFELFSVQQCSSPEPPLLASADQLSPEGPPNPPDSLTSTFCPSTPSSQVYIVFSASMISQQTSPSPPPPFASSQKPYHQTFFSLPNPALGNRG